MSVEIIKAMSSQVEAAIQLANEKHAKAYAAVAVPTWTIASHVTDMLEASAQLTVLGQAKRALDHFENSDELASDYLANFMSDLEDDALNTSHINSTSNVHVEFEILQREFTVKLYKSLRRIVLVG
jgi:hypothetical protein